MEQDGRFFVYWNKKYMVYETDEEEIDTITIYRKYMGIKKHVIPEETRIIVKGSDGNERDVNEEAIFYFKQQGLNAVRTKSYIEMKKGDYALHNFLDNSKIRRIISNEDLKKIKSREDPYVRIYQLDMTGYPDLFVWNNDSNYFFVEVKSENDKFHLNQREWIKWNRRIGKFKFKILEIKKK